MATSLTPTNEKTTGGAKKYLDFAGLNSLWDNICDKFSPQWKTVSFDYISQDKLVPNASTIDLSFLSISDEPNATTGVINRTETNQKTLIFPAATQEKAGLMTAADKKKLDESTQTSENLVTIKKIKVGNQLSGGSTYNAAELTIDSNKVVAFGLDYAADTDLLSIVDLNSNKKILSQVHVLGDAIKTLTGFTDADVIVKDGDTYLKFVLNVTNQDGSTQSKTLEINVNDLVSTYTAGDGIDLTQTSTTTNDDTETGLTIKLIAPKTVSSVNKIGGIIPKKIYSNSITSANWGNSTGTTVPTVQALGTSSARYFGVETDGAGHAFVNVPVATFTRGTSTNATGTVNNNGGNGTFTAMTGFDWSLSDDGQTYTLTPNYTDFTVQKETKLSINEHAFTQSDIALSGNTNKSVKYISGIGVNDHGITVTTKTFNIKESELAFATDVNATAVTLIPGTATSISPITGLDKDAHHTLKKTITSVTVADPASIELTYIDGLKWEIPA
jgi:hypothetical protein